MAQAAPAVPGNERPDEAEMAGFAERVPGLGGYHFAADGALVVDLADPAQESAARHALAGVAARGDGRMRVRPARYTFQQLRAWRDGWSDRLLDLPGVSFVDLDEAANQLVVGLAEPSARARALDLLRGAGIPVPAVTFERAGYVRSEAGVREYAPYIDAAPVQGDSLTSYRRPLEGGLKLTYREPSNPDWPIPCTTGFVATLNGVRVMITASHCSLRQWWSDNTSFFQAQPGAGRYFGYEYRDPGGEVCGIAEWSICRHSEALAIAIEPDVEAALGRIARPVAPPPLGRSPYGNPVSSLRIDPANPAFTLVGRGTLNDDVKLSKVGAATGWTEGRVARTCVDLRVERPNGRIRCQVYALYSSAGGDSGAPVFIDNGNGTALLVGMHWGATTDNAYAVFSSLAGIERDLGTLQFVPGSGGDGGNTGPIDPGSGCNPECVS